LDVAEVDVGRGGPARVDGEADESSVCTRQIKVR
jgi:hypothetical protein